VKALAIPFFYADDEKRVYKFDPVFVCLPANIPLGGAEEIFIGV
jgi:hypothetical protein